jgi:hypothetical protein
MIVQKKQLQFAATAWSGKKKNVPLAVTPDKPGRIAALVIVY